MTAAADRVRRRSGAAAARRYGFAALTAGIITFVPVPAAAAQIGAIVSVFSDHRFRGVSVSDGRPVGTLDLSYDAPNGLYASLSGSVVDARGEGPRGLGVVFNGGYAKRLRSGLTADVGVVDSRFSHYSGLYGRAYTEVYAGLAGKVLGGRISVSPNYFGVARWTVHGQADAHWDLSAKASLEGEAGLLVPLGDGAYKKDLRAQFDARVGIARRAGPMTFHVAVTSRSGSDAIYGASGHGRVALVLGVSAAL